MLRWTVIFLIVAVIAAIFGFGGIAAAAIPLVNKTLVQQGFQSNLKKYFSG